jgi:hypothetical protein
MLSVSGLSEKLQNIQTPDGEPHVLYGDPAYGVNDNILAPYRGAQLTQNQSEFNKRMSKVRVSMEWVFGKSCLYFSFLDFKKTQKILLQPVAKCYMVGSVLCNCNTCLYGSVPCSFFKVQPPLLETYLSNKVTVLIQNIY